MKKTYSHFYIDESGNTGMNLFDESQPALFYGLLASRKDLESSAKDLVEEMRILLNVKQLHANEIGISGFQKILPILKKLDKELELRFEVSYLIKADTAFICFFDQVFDQGMNPAVPWASYWTPLRYLLMIHLSQCFDWDLLKKAWEARIARNDTRAHQLLKPILQEVLRRSQNIRDKRASEIITQALEWAIDNIPALHYHSGQSLDPLQIAPNVLAFQAIIKKIGDLSSNLHPRKIAVFIDEQTQFNKAQLRLGEMYSKGAGQSYSLGPGMPEHDLKHIPTEPFKIAKSHENIGIEIVDLYIWLFKRNLIRDDLPTDLKHFIESKNTSPFYISMAGIEERAAGAILNSYNSPLTAEKIKFAEDFLKLQEQKRLEEMAAAKIKKK